MTYFTGIPNPCKLPNDLATRRHGLYFPLRTSRIAATGIRGTCMCVHAE